MSAVIGIFETQYLNNFPLTVVSPGNQKRDFTHVKDIVDGFIQAGFNKKNQEYQLASGKLYTILQVAKMFKSKIKMIPVRPGERFSSKRDSLKKSKRELNFNSKYNLKDYIENFINQNKKWNYSIFFSLISAYDGTKWCLTLHPFIENIPLLLK